MYNDIIIRDLILQQMPGVEPWRMEMEDVDFGDRIGVFYRSADKGVIRHAVRAKGRTDSEIADDFIQFLTNEPDEVSDAPQSLCQESEGASAEVSELAAQDMSKSEYEGRRGRHPRTCTCSTCLAKKAVDGAAPPQ